MEILKKVQFSDLTNWSVRYLLDFSFNYNKNYDLQPIGDFLTKNRDSVLIEATTEYKRVKVKTNGNGVVLRNIEKGLNIGTKKQIRVKKGQFIVSKIDARNGAMGLIPDYLDNAIVTNDFPTFSIDKNKINPTFLLLITTTKTFIKFAQSCSSGTTNRQRININQFLGIKIPLPPLEEQNRIVENYNRKINLANEQEQKAKQLEQEIEDYLFEVLGIEKLEEKEKQLLKIVKYSNLDRWDNTKSFVLNSKYPVIKVKDIIDDISTGTTPPTSRREYFDNGKINFYTPADLTGKMYLTEANRKVTKLAIEDGKSRKFKKNTLLFVGIGSTVGKVGIIANEFATSNQQITGLYFDRQKTNIEYLYYYFTNFQNITTNEKTQATIPIVNQDKIINIPIPYPPLKIQMEIANHISTLKLQIKDLQNQAKENREKAIQEFEQEIFN